MDDHKIYNWSAKRSGATITVEGVSAQGNAIKIGQVESMQIDEAGPFVIFGDGKTYRLASDTLPF